MVLTNIVKKETKTTLKKMNPTRKLLKKEMEALKNLMSYELTNIPEEVVRKLEAVEIRLTGLLYAVDRQRYVLNANLYGFLE